MELLGQVKEKKKKLGPLRRNSVEFEPLKFCRLSFSSAVTAKLFFWGIWNHCFKILVPEFSVVLYYIIYHISVFVRCYKFLHFLHHLRNKSLIVERTPYNQFLTRTTSCIRNNTWTELSMVTHSSLLVLNIDTFLRKGFLWLRGWWLVVVASGVAIFDHRKHKISNIPLGHPPPPGLPPEFNTDHFMHLLQEIIY